MSSSACALVMGRDFGEPAHPGLCGDKVKRFQARENTCVRECLYCSPFGRETDSLHMLSVNVLTSGCLKLLNEAHLTGTI